MSKGWVREADFMINQVIHDMESDPRSLLQSEYRSYLIDDSPERFVVRHLRHPKCGSLQDLSPCPPVGCDILGEENTAEKDSTVKGRRYAFAYEQCNPCGEW